jgi:outer membrane protein assembly factor BamB
VNGGTGAKLWEFATSSQVPSSPTIGPDGTVYIGSTDYFVYALDGSNGDEEMGVSRRKTP